MRQVGPNQTSEKARSGAKSDEHTHEHGGGGCRWRAYALDWGLALWELDDLVEAVVANARPEPVGIASIATAFGSILPRHARYIRFGPGQPVRVIFGPGMVGEISVAEHHTVAEGTRIHLAGATRVVGPAEIRRAKFVVWPARGLPPRVMSRRSCIQTATVACDRAPHWLKGVRMEIPRDHLVDMYSTMVKIRYFEERIREIYFADKLPAFDIGAGEIPGEMHLAAGQEPVAVGTMPHLFFF